MGKINAISLIKILCNISCNEIVWQTFLINFKVTKPSKLITCSREKQPQWFTTPIFWHIIPLSLHPVTFSFKSNSSTLSFHCIDELFSLKRSSSKRWKGETLFCRLCIRHFDTSCISTRACFSKWFRKKKKKIHCSPNLYKSIINSSSASLLSNTHFSSLDRIPESQQTTTAWRWKEEGEISCNFLFTARNLRWCSLSACSLDLGVCLDVETVENICVLHSRVVWSNVCC